MRPDAPATSPYPHSCYYNPFSLGAVQGVQQGWASPVFGGEAPVQLTPGRYDVTARITPAYTDALGISAADATRSFRLVVQQEETLPRPRSTAGPPPAPAAAEPTAAAAGEVAGTRPDLRSLPAFGMDIARNGDFLRFFATVWNGGDSPLVVDGFRRAGEDVMDAYQYFFDADGNQTGYQRVGADGWDDRGTTSTGTSGLRPLRAARRRQGGGGPLQEGGVLPRQDRRGRLDRPGRGLERREHRPVHRLRRPLLALHPRGAGLRLGRHLRPVPRRPVASTCAGSPTAPTTWR